jgi:hypothetical protein
MEGSVACCEASLDKLGVIGNTGSARTGFVANRNVFKTNPGVHNVAGHVAFQIDKSRNCLDASRLASNSVPSRIEISNWL